MSEPWSAASFDDDPWEAGGDAAGGVGRREVGPAESVRAGRSWWDANADEYQAEHGDFLGDARFVWGPEGLDEQDAQLLGDVEGRRILEVGAGAAQCARNLAARGAYPVALDLSYRQLQHSRRIDAAVGLDVPVIQADAAALPFADESFDTAFSAYGALPFSPEGAKIMREVHRVLKPGGRWVFSLTHPIRWAFPDDPGEGGLTAAYSYFDITPYVEEDEDGHATYVEHHRTLGMRVREAAAAGFRIVDLIEPEWPEALTQVWGGWSPTRGRKLPGTAIFVCDKD
ncbi:class I SAM-dependent methyltransferase [Yinghuangia seranimata]|uniref:class I SAM-dependent methyltransferase n=1 Tax=Yinghuangia seranimata TaxID=408067 RepID=UPI00248CD186|nr:class I SAM-dependent methyltransferase [Yinghuangia seranimata]MDI2126264.1 class I SAM-dependent methyltransferase [Yinghuangia seranimata]